MPQQTFPAPKPDESLERYTIRCATAASDMDPDEFNEAVWETWRRYRGPTDEEEVARRKLDPERYQHVPGVCVFAEHKTTTADGKIEVTGTWTRGRTGVYREGKGYGGMAKGPQGESPVGAYDGYRPLLVEIVKFFRTGTPPVYEAETLEIYAFMEAADESKRQGGKPISLESVFRQANERLESNR